MSTVEPAPTREVVVVRRWKRYGHDRAYVVINGMDVGYRDLASDEVVCTHARHRQTIATVTEGLAARARTSRYQPRHAAAEDDAPASDEAASAAATTLLPDMDIADNRPGQHVRVHADALRDAAPGHTFLARLLGAKTDERSYRIGADAEVEVARRLAKLGGEWRVIHSIPVGERGSDIDHLVIGPAGVFTINTKHHPTANVWVRGDTFKLNGQNQDYVRNSRHEAARAAKLLTARAQFDVQVTGLIAVMGATGGYTVKEQPADGRVVIVKRKEVARYLSSLPARLDAPRVERIHSVARHLATWQPKLVEWADF